MFEQTQVGLASAIFLPLVEKMRTALETSECISEKRRLARLASLSLALILPVFRNTGGVFIKEWPSLVEARTSDFDRQDIPDQLVDQILAEASQKIESAVLLIDYSPVPKPVATGKS